MLGAISLTLAMAASQAQPLPFRPQGSFIQYYLVKDWTDEQWQREFRYLRDLKMQYLIFAPTVEDDQAYYPTSINGLTEANKSHDTVDSCLRNAQASGIKVFLGLNFSEKWWNKGPSDPEWLNGQMDVGNAIAKELYGRYHSKYRKALYGWYWVWEVENYQFRDEAHATVLGKALETNVAYLKHLSPSMPIMLCPYMNCQLGKPEAYGKFWASVFAKTSLGKGDIFAPQDCIGAGWLNLDVLASWFKELKTAVGTKPGIRFWVDSETFDQRDWSSATLDRFDKQLRTVAPYVESGVTFAYSHYWSPNVANPGWHAAFKRYLDSGAIVAAKVPAPTALSGHVGPNGVELSWKATKGPLGDCGFDVFRDGKRIVRIQPPKDLRKQGEVITYIDKNADASSRFHYEVSAYDFFGNLSEKVAVTGSPTGDEKVRSR